MIGVLINAILIILGSLIGINFSKLLKDSYKVTLMDAVGLSTILIGIVGVLKADNIILSIISLTLGSLIGEILALEDKLVNFGKGIESKLSRGNISKGFVSASILFCVGAMAIVGSIEAGILNIYDTLITKSILDGITSIILASTLGIGVILSSVSVFVYQGLIVIFSSSISHILSDYMINQLLVVGSVLIIGLGLNMLELKNIKIVNMLPSMVVVILLSLFM